MDYFGAIFIVIYFVVGVYFIWCFIEIATKAGYSGIFGFSLIIPIVNFVTLGILAFEEWPIKKTLSEQGQIIAGIVARDIEKLRRGDTSSLRRQDFHSKNIHPE